MKEDYFVALLATILLSGRGFAAEGIENRKVQDRLAMLEGEKKIAIAEARDILEMAKRQ